MYKHKCKHNVEVDGVVYKPNGKGELELPIIYKSVSCEPLEKKKKKKVEVSKGIADPDQETINLDGKPE